MLDKLNLGHIKMLVETHQAGVRRDTHNDGEQAAKNLERVVELAEDAQQAIARIDKDERLTEAGKIDARAGVATRTLAALDAWHTPLARGLAEHKSALESELRALVELPPPRDAAEVVRDAIIGGEVRATARGLNDAGAQILYRIGGAVVRRALLGVPRITVSSAGIPAVRPFITEELRRSVMLEEGGKLRPEAVEMIADCELHAGAYSACGGALKGALQGLVSVAAVERLATRGVGGDTGVSTAIDTNRFIDPQTGRPLPRA